MSFILDALKKSEIERQRQSIPGLVEAGPVRPRQRLPLWAIALCGLLAINLIVLLVVLVRGRMTPHATADQLEREQTAQTSRHAGSADRLRTESAREDGEAGPDTATGNSPGDGAGSTNASAGTRAANRAGISAASAERGSTAQNSSDSSMYAPEIPVTNAAALPGSAPIAAGTSTANPPGPVPATRPADVPSGSSGTHTIRRRDPVLTSEDYKADDEEVLPTINEIHLTGAQALPELHLDVHVFATHSPERFVFINMRKYHEGATLQEGPTIERIRRDGVILNYQGLRFLLPRQ